MESIHIPEIQNENSPLFCLVFRAHPFFQDAKTGKLFNPASHDAGVAAEWGVGRGGLGEAWVSWALHYIGRLTKLGSVAFRHLRHGQL